MFKKIKKILLLLLLTILLTLPYFVFAENGDSSLETQTNPLNRLEYVGSERGNYQPADRTTLSSTAGLVINILLGFLGIIFVVLIIMAGLTWMTANGNEEKIKQAKGRLQNAIIGLIIVIAAYSIWAFIASRLL